MYVQRRCVCARYTCSCTQAIVRLRCQWDGTAGRQGGVEELLQRTSALWSSNALSNASALNESVVGQFRWFCLKIGYRGNVPWAIENEDHVRHVQSFFYYLVKNWQKLGPVDPKIIWCEEKLTKMMRSNGGRRYSHAASKHVGRTK